MTNRWVDQNWLPPEDQAPEYVRKEKFEEAMGLLESMPRECALGEDPGKWLQRMANWRLRVYEFLRREGRDV